MSPATSAAALKNSLASSGSWPGISPARSAAALKNSLASSGNCSAMSSARPATTPAAWWAGPATWFAAPAKWFAAPAAWFAAPARRARGTSHIPCATDDIFCAFHHVVCGTGESAQAALQFTPADLCPLETEHPEANCNVHGLFQGFNDLAEVHVCHNRSVPLAAPVPLLRSGSLMGPELTAPGVVAVVVASGPTPWLDEALASLAGRTTPTSRCS